MNSDGSLVRDVLFSVTSRPLCATGEQVVYDINNHDIKLLISPKPMDEYVTFSFQKDYRNSVLIYNAPIPDFMRLMNKVFNHEDDEVLCSVVINFHPTKDHYVVDFHELDDVPTMEIEGSLVRDSLLRVWIGLIKSYQGYSLWPNERLVDENIPHWQVWADEQELVIEGLFHYGISLALYNMLNRGRDTLFFDNSYHRYRSLYLKAIAFGLAYLSDYNVVLRKGEVLYPDLPRIAREFKTTEIRWYEVQ